MAMKITDECICCRDCMLQCPVHAISQKSEEKLEIDPDICNECEGFSERPSCADLCSVGCIVKA